MSNAYARDLATRYPIFTSETGPGQNRTRTTGGSRGRGGESTRPCPHPTQSLEEEANIYFAPPQKKQKKKQIEVSNRKPGINFLAFLQKCIENCIFNEGSGYIFSNLKLLQCFYFLFRHDIGKCVASRFCAGSPLMRLESVLGGAKQARVDPNNFGWGQTDSYRPKPFWVGPNRLE